MRTSCHYCKGSDHATPPNSCEYNPAARRASHCTEHHAVATTIVGANGKWRLCDSCAALPEFRRFRSRKKDRGHPAMDLVMCVDPGLRICGVALYKVDDRGLFAASPCFSKVSPPITGRIAWAAMADAVMSWSDDLLHNYKIHYSILPSVVELVMENPQTYKGQSRRADVDSRKSLPELRGVNTHIAKHMAAEGVRGKNVVRYTPHQWKRNVDKRITRKRMRKVLSKAEQSYIAMPDDHNVWDAVGIGLHHNRRLKEMRWTL